MAQLHFPVAEFETRQRAVREAMSQAGLDGMLLFRQESMYYLTGYDTDGFVLFQTLFLSLEGDLRAIVFVIIVFKRLFNGEC